jgi:hypothetical protein
MLSKDKTIQTYQENYQLAWEDGHMDKASEVAWMWTEEELNALFQSAKSQYNAQREEAINKAFYN